MKGEIGRTGKLGRGWEGREVWEEREEKDCSKKIVSTMKEYIDVKIIRKNHT